MNKETFVYVIYIAATPQRIWDALVKGELARQYWKRENISDWKVGSKWEHVTDDGRRTVKIMGEILECVPGRRLAMTWADPVEFADSTKHSRVAIDIEPVGEMVRMTVVHEELSRDMAGKISAGWPRVLSSLKSFLETGRPLDTWA